VVSSKGQVIIPKSVRDARRWTAGTRLEVRDTPEGVLLARIPAGAKNPLAVGLAAIRARVAYQGPAKTIAEMNAAVSREAARRKSGR